MVFTDYMKSLPNQQMDTIKKLAEITCSTPASVYRWINGLNPPAPIKQKIIAEYLGMSVEELFPSKDEWDSQHRVLQHPRRGCYDEGVRAAGCGFG